MTKQRAGRAAKTNKWLRWTIGAAVGVAVGLLGVAIHDSGDTYRCDFAISDTESQRRWGLTYAAEICDRGDRGLPLPPLNYGGETPGWEHVGNGWGALVAAAGFGLLTWLVPLAIGRLQRPPRPTRPDPLQPGGKVYWSEDGAAWRTTASQDSSLYRWTYDPKAHAWTRGEKVPTTGATRSETWALRRDELLRQQNRLIEEQNRLPCGAAAARARADGPARQRPTSRRRALERIGACGRAGPSNDRGMSGKPDGSWTPSRAAAGEKSFKRAVLGFSARTWAAEGSGCGHSGRADRARRGAGPEGLHGTATGTRGPTRRRDTKRLATDHRHVFGSTKPHTRTAAYACPRGVDDNMSMTDPPYSMHRPSHPRIGRGRAAYPTGGAVSARIEDEILAAEDVTTMTHFTDLGRELAAIREEALRRIQLVEGRRIEQVKLFDEWRPLSTDELVSRVESHADTWAQADEFGAVLLRGLGRWAA